MKKLILLFAILLCSYSCGTQDETTYEFTITYTIGGNSFTEMFSENLPSTYTPNYSTEKDIRGKTLLKVVGLKGYNVYPIQLVYSGRQEVKVVDFQYKAVRYFKASRFDGHEVKRKR